MMVETKIGENGKIQKRQMGWMEDLGKNGIQKVETWERLQAKNDVSNLL